MVPFLVVTPASPPTPRCSRRICNQLDVLDKRLETARAEVQAVQEQRQELVVRVDALAASLCEAEAEKAAVGGEI